MKDILKKWLGSRKFVLAVLGGLIIYLNPSINAQQLAGILGLPGLYIVIEGLKDLKVSK
jgi:hypothetical protein